MLTRPQVGGTTLFWNGIVKLQLYSPKSITAPWHAERGIFSLSLCNNVKMI